MDSKDKNALPDKLIEGKINEFIKYNRAIIEEDPISHNYHKQPKLKSKLLFMDYRFLKMQENSWYILGSNILDTIIGRISKSIFTIGREGYNNNMEVPGGTEISRRHCLIINFKDDVWLYDLSSTGTYLNDELVVGRMPIVGHSILRIGKAEYKITTDKTKML
jgi:hypothetical protein